MILYEALQYVSKQGWNLPIWYFHLHFRVLCTMGTCRVISGWWVALRLGQFNHMCLYLLDMFPSELVASTSSLSCLLTQSLICGFTRGPKCLSFRTNATNDFPTASIFTSWHLVLNGAPNSSMALDNLSKSSSLQSPEVSWVKEIWSQKSGRWIRNQKTNFVFLSLKIFTKQLSGLHQPATTAHYLLVSQAQPPRANLTLSCHQQSWIHA